ncbi:hypothetical protein [Nocardia macrotermitis]|uniref:DUF4386 family protein n=1 Tax=Nocardia macrotermitis TaxID=2585198 RepID=A0A7K0D9R6_9NOCA|nr:hypothetical protein [Nocardia macrotermitis]MQY22516.1 hypothetical protein [Nocardia macrotermitis]
MQVLLEDENRSAATNLRAQQVILWSTPVVAAVLLVLLAAFPGFFPPMSPNLTATQVAEFYRDHTAMIRFSMVGFNLCGILIVPFFVLILARMQRMRGQSHIFAFSYLAAVVAGATLFALSDIFFGVAAFRPDRSADLIQLLNDLAWIFFIAPIGMLVAQFVLLALAIYFDDVRDPVFPRWVAHYSLVTAVLMAPSAGAAVFRNGPLAWNGVVSFWLRNIAFAVFVVVMFFVLRASYRREARESA